AVRVTGNPIRGYFAPATTANRQLAVLGGSGGARSLNQQAPLAIYRLKGHLEGWRIVHQTGEADVEATRLLYGKLGLSAQVTAFVDDMPTLLAASSVALCRAGGTTLAELAAAEVPSVLVPYPHATSDHQRRNAEVHAQAGGAMIVDERDEGPLPARLAAALGPLVAEPRRRERMAWNLRQLARPGATREVASLVVEAIDAQWERAVLRCA
ncbi:MAG: UDP-N-acetylglucosamine--N-acetylmuramyl-(pentapeptide) pyrophosphoryl-undecaprenol N-acetylglucosamine transferase, partial [Planctomycetota bacterium]